MTFLRAARFTDQNTRLPHQDAAWNWAWGLLTPQQQQTFMDMFRAAPEFKLPLKDNDWLQQALKIIKEFEGCRLVAYPDPGTGGEPWTVGWGTTRIDGKPVKQGTKLTQKEADELLLIQVQGFGEAVKKLFPLSRDWPANRIAALTSWAYNVGLGAVEESTLRARMLDREDPKTVAREELPRWNKGGGKVMPGLVRRREAEVQLFLGNTNQSAAEPKLPEIQQQAARLSPGAAFTMHITPHIRLGEFALDQKERRFERQHQLDTAAELACFLERVRRNFENKPIIITSGYRPPAINKACGGAANSEHLYSVPGEGAVDFYVDGADINAVQQFCDKYWEHSVGYGAKKGFVHLGRRADGHGRRWDY